MNPPLAATGAPGAGHNVLLPRQPGGNGAGAALALVAHAGLIAALTVSVDWRSQPPDVVSAELWSSVPQVAAPRAEAPVAVPTPAPAPPPEPVRSPPPPPPPAPPPPAPVPAPAPVPRAAIKPLAPAPDIVTERERRRAEFDRKKPAPAPTPAPVPPPAKPPPPERVDRSKLEAERRKDAQEAKAEEDRLARLREDNLRRMMGQASQTGQTTSSTGSAGETDSRGTAAQSSGPSAAYAGIVAKVIRDQSVFTSTVPGNPAAEVEVRSGPGGTIVSRRLIKSSGVRAWDDAVLQAIDKVGRLPADEKGRVPPQMIIAFRPNP